MWRAVTRTHTGNVRTNNEDLALWDSQLGVLVVADGMGGHNAGEVASRLAVDALQQSLVQTVASGPAADRLHEAMTKANREVFRTSHERPECAGMGTTLTAAILDDNRVTVSSVGDSRLYTLRGHELQQVTRDDSLMGALMDVAGIDPAELEHHPMRHLLTNVVGRKPELESTAAELTMEDGDLLFLSTDGVHGVLSAETITAILRTDPDLERTADMLITAALAAESKDNVTVAVARYGRAT